MVDENVEKEKVNRSKRSVFFYFEVLHLVFFIYCIRLLFALLNFVLF